MTQDNLLLFADSERDADMLYAAGLFVPDPFLFLRIRGKGHVIVSDLEVDRARRVASHCRVLASSRYQQRLKRNGVKRAGVAHIIQSILRERHLKKIHVPACFPVGLARQLRDLGVKVKVKDG